MRSEADICLEAKALFEDIYSLHVYSVEPTPLEDLHVLSEVVQDIAAFTAKEDPLEYGKKYGVIQNPNVKRRTRKGLPPVPSSTAVPKENAKPAKATETKAQPKHAEDTSRPSSRGDEKATSQGSKAQTQTQDHSKTSTSRPPALKRDTSDIFKSFAKAKPKLKKEDTDTSAVDSVCVFPGTAWSVNSDCTR